MNYTYKERFGNLGIINDTVVNDCIDFLIMAKAALFFH